MYIFLRSAFGSGFSGRMSSELDKSSLTVVSALLLLMVLTIEGLGLDVPQRKR